MFLGSLWKKLFGTANERIIKSLSPIVREINLLELKISALSDNELANQTIKLKEKLQNGSTLDDILPEAFATVREVAKRTLSQRHFDVQMMGGIILHRGKIPEMGTGEGKTLVSTLPIYLNALSGKGVHVITVNDYLAKRDSEWMGVIYKFLGLNVGCITNDLDPDYRAEEYNKDITYGTNNEFGFDYLRDNMKYSIDQLVQRPFNYAIIDEVDSILIDEARTPLVISGPTDDNSSLYYRIDKLIPQLSDSDFEKDEKSKTVFLTEEGTVKIEELMKEHGFLVEDTNLYDIENMSLIHHINQALRAHKLFTKDVDYMILDSKVMIIDEFTGRVMEGRRYSEGLHQALEAKENVEVQNENQTLASITFQNYFRLYPKLSGMTGSAMTEANEFREIYNLEVIALPTNIKAKRIDEDDVIYRTYKEKYHAIIEEIEERHKVGQPILVGTVSIEKSEFLSSLLKKKNIKHQVLNAKYHEQEASIIAQAGRLGAITIATNMAGRGTDIKLGGNEQMLIDHAIEGIDDDNARNELIESITKSVEENKAKVLEAGGLFVIGTERHESRRIDNQLRGRSGRQGDLGRTKFFLSLEDDLMRIFASERISGLLGRLGLKENEAIFHPMISRALERAQQRVEAMHYDVRKNLLKFDDVMNDQRKIIYDQRLDIIESDDVLDTLCDMYRDCNETLIDNHIPNNTSEEDYDTEGLTKELLHIYGINIPITEWLKDSALKSDLLEKLDAHIENFFEEKEEKYGHDVMKMARKRFLLMTLDQLWKEHLHGLDHLRQGINLRAYGQRDPLNEYKKEAFTMFEGMLSQLQMLFISRISHVEVSQNPHHMLDEDYAPKQKMRETRIDPAFAQEITIGAVKNNVAKEDRVASDENSWGKVGRNELCPCGSELKYKHCHGKL
jgi:preprotein translocase subunit SecA